LAPSAPAGPPPLHALPLNPFKMHSLLLALPDPMLLESTLPMPTVMVQAYQPPQPATQAKNSKLVHDLTQLHLPHNAPLFHGPDGEPWLSEDSFHAYDGPSAFGPDTTWEREQTLNALSAPTDPSQSENLDSEVEFRLLPLGLLDSPPHQLTAKHHPKHVRDAHHPATPCHCFPRHSPTWPPTPPQSP
jgi:hypothetical protein